MGNLPTEHFQDDGAEFIATVSYTQDTLPAESLVSCRSSSTNNRSMLTQQTLPLHVQLQRVKERGCDTWEIRKHSEIQALHLDWGRCRRPERTGQVSGDLPQHWLISERSGVIQRQTVWLNDQIKANWCLVLEKIFH